MRVDIRSLGVSQPRYASQNSDIKSHGLLAGAPPFVIHTYVLTGRTLASPTSTSLSAIMDNGEATGCLGSMLGRQLRIYTTDTRMFVGEFKCTDNVLLLM